MKKSLLSFITALCIVFIANGTVFTSQGSGNYNAGGTWDQSGSTPGAGDTIIIADQHTVTVSVDDSCALLTINASTGFAFSQLTISTGITFTCTGDMTINSGTFFGGKIQLVGTSTLTVNGDISFVGASPSFVESDLDMSNGTSTLNIGGAFNLTTNSETLKRSTSSNVNYNGTSNQTIRFASGFRYHDLTINNTGINGATLGGAVNTTNVNGSITVQSGTFRNGGNTISGQSGETFRVDNGATFILTAFSSWPNSYGTDTLYPSSTVNYAGLGQTVSSSQTYGHLSLSGTGTKSLNGVTNIAGNLTIGASTTLDITASNYQINIGGDWTNNNVFIQRSGKINLNGSSAQALSGNTSFHHLEANNTSGGVTITSGGGNMVTITDTLSTTNGTITTNDNLTLQSGAGGTAMVIPGSGSVSGNATIQRYLPAGSDDWHLLSPTVSGSTLEDYNAELTIVGMTGADVGGTPSFYTYNESLSSGTDPDTGWEAFTTTATGMSRGVGYIGYIYASDLPATLDLSGPITTGNHSWTLSYTSTGDANNDGWNLVGNPYPFPIDWDAASGWTRTGMASTMHYYDPSIDDYKGYNHTTGLPINGGVQYLASHQGFWIQVDNGTNSFQATNSIRSASSDPIFQKTVASYEEPSQAIITLGLYSPLDKQSHQELIVNFTKNATDLYESNYDSYQLRSYNPNKTFFASIAENKNLAVNSLNKLDKTYNIPIYIDVPVDTNYLVRVLDISPSIKNKVCGDIKITDLGGSTLLDFNTSEYLIVNIKPDTTNTTQATLYLKIDPAIIADYTPSQDTIDLKQNNNISFSNISVTSDAYYWDFGDGTTTNTENPNHTFTNPGTYSVMLVAYNSSCSISDTIYKTIVVKNTTGIDNKDNFSQINVYPNPTSGDLFITLKNSTDIVYELYDILGKRLESVSTKGQNNQTIYIDLNSYETGIYFLKISDNNSSITKKVVLNK